MPLTIYRYTVVHLDHFHRVLSLPTTKPKTWASLSSSPSPSTGLPASSAVDISIHPSAPPLVAPAKKQTLLTHGPRAVQKIDTRGLINSGNMCFANAVLQVLVYCSPLQRLFIELGKFLLLCSPSPSINGHGHRHKSQTPSISSGNS